MATTRFTRCLVFNWLLIGAEDFDIVRFREILIFRYRLRLPYLEGVQLQV